MEIKEYFDKVKDLTEHLDLSIDKIDQEKNSINFALAFLSIPEEFNMDLDYDLKEEIIKSRYNLEKNYVILKMANELQKLDRECDSEIKTLNKYKEIDKRVEEKLKVLGLERKE